MESSLAPIQKPHAVPCEYHDLLQSHTQLPAFPFRHWVKSKSRKSCAKPHNWASWIHLRLGDRGSRYPENNRRFEAVDKDPTKKRYDVDERTTVSDDKQFTITAWSNQKYYLNGDQAELFVTLQDENGRVINTKFIGQLIYNEQSNARRSD